MKQYKIKFEALEPRFGEIDGIHAETADDAQSLALIELEASYPEYLDIDITEVEEINA